MGLSLCKEDTEEIRQEKNILQSGENFQRQIKSQEQQPQQQNNNEQQQQSQKDIIQYVAQDIKLENYKKFLSNQAIRCQQILYQDGKPMNRNMHYFYEDFQKNQSNMAKYKRLQKEFIFLKKNLPIQESNSIFVAYDKSRVDIIKSIIIGAENTPYQNGVFLFDTFYDDGYPIQPPKCRLATTGGETLRFNPNLYKDGKICLSILGTWRGDSVEKWSPSSNMCHVLISIQTLVMSEEVYLNEPGTSKSAKYYQQLNQGYSNIVRLGTVKHAITDMINNPPKQFQDIILVHFYLKKDEIIKQVEKWIEEAQLQQKQAIPPLYSEFVQLHNSSYAHSLKQNPKNYENLLRAEYVKMKKALESISQDQILDIINGWEKEQ